MNPFTHTHTHTHTLSLSLSLSLSLCKQWLLIYPSSYACCSYLNNRQSQLPFLSAPMKNRHLSVSFHGCGKTNYGRDTRKGRPEADDCTVIHTQKKWLQTHTHTNTHTHAHTHTHTHMQNYTHTLTHTHKHMQTLIHTCTLAYTQIHTLILWWLIHKCTLTHTHTHTVTHTHTHPHTHMHAWHA